MIRTVVVLPLLALFACKGDDDLVWRQFNGADDSFQIEVEPGDPSGLALLVLTSNTGAVDVGEAVVDPAKGPVGTEHTLVVEVYDQDDWTERVERATVTSLGERGEETYSLTLDNAAPGVFQLVLTSLGEPDERRVDTWRVDLFESVDNPESEETE